MFRSTKFSLVTVGLVALSCLTPGVLATNQGDVLGTARRGEATVISKGSTTKKESNSQLTHGESMSVSKREALKSDVIFGTVGNLENQEINYKIDIRKFFEEIEEKIDQDAKELQDRYESMRSQAQAGTKENSEFSFKSEISLDLGRAIPNDEKSILALKEFGKQLKKQTNESFIPTTRIDENNPSESDKNVGNSSEAREYTQSDKIPSTDHRNTHVNVERRDNLTPLGAGPAYQPGSLLEPDFERHRADIPENQSGEKDDAKKSSPAN